MPESAQQAAERPSGTVLAFDFGEKRIGVAVGERLLAQAHPLTTLRGERNDERFAAIAALIAEWQPTSLVVGLPVALDGSAHAMTARCTRFANQLRGRFGLPVDYAEERRLLFVGMTRATTRLTLLTAVKRTLRGELTECAPSPFLSSVDPALLDRRGGDFAGRGHRRPRVQQAALF